MNSNAQAAIRWLPLRTILTGSGLLTEEQLAHALEAQEHRGGRLGDVLVELGYVALQQIAGAVAAQCDLQVVDLDATEIEPEAVALLPESLARRYLALPIRRAGDGLMLAIADLTNLHTADDLRLALGARSTSPSGACRRTGASRWTSAASRSTCASRCCLCGTASRSCCGS